MSVAKDFSSLDGILSVPGDFDRSSSSGILVTPEVVISMLGMSGYNPKSRTNYLEGESH